MTQIWLRTEEYRDIDKGELINQICDCLDGFIVGGAVKNAAIVGRHVANHLHHHYLILEKSYRKPRAPLKGTADLRVDANDGRDWLASSTGEYGVGEVVCHSSEESQTK